MPSRIPPERSSLAVAQAVQRGIRTTRRQLRLKQAEMARRTGLSPALLRRLERAEIDMPLSRFIQVCRALGVSPATLLQDQVDA